MPILMIGKGVATVLGAILMLAGRMMMGTDLEPVAGSVSQIGEYVTEFGLIRKGIVDGNLFGKVR